MSVTAENSFVGYVTCYSIYLSAGLPEFMGECGAYNCRGNKPHHMKTTVHLIKINKRRRTVDTATCALVGSFAEFSLGQHVCTCKYNVFFIKINFENFMMVLLEILLISISSEFENITLQCYRPRGCRSRKSLKCMPS